MKTRLLAAAAALAVAAPVAAQTAAPAATPAAAPEVVRVIHAGTLIAEPGRPAMRNASVVIRGRKISEIRPGFADVAGAQVIDLRNATVMPGLIDMHVHLVGLDDRIQDRLNENIRDAEDEAYTALLNARKTLLAGFTTVRDLGGDPRTILSLRDAINANQFSGPTIVAAARMVSISGGHGRRRRCRG
jgi:imidazolonepropionase-like amidohydrolase